MTYDLSKEFAAKLGILLESKLIHYKYYELWCDEIIEYAEDVPYWIIELTSTKYLPAAIHAVNTYAYSEPFIDFNYLHLNNFHLACTYVRYAKRHISWATFLINAGSYSDGNSCCKDCAYFYQLLNQLEEQEYALILEHKQAEEVRQILANLISESEELYEHFLTYFRTYVIKHHNNNMIMHSDGSK